MAHSDDVIWGLISHGFCSYKAKTITQTFCRNEYNVSGLCNRQSCPLANSRYATVREREGKCYLYIKTIERQHLPSQLWEEIPLDKNLEKALAQIDDHLEFWPGYIINKNKQRLLKITQYLIRMRKLKLQPQIKRRRIDKKLERRERTKEDKAEKIALIDNKIKAELIERLKQGTYGEMYSNFRPEVWNEVLDEQEVSQELENEDEFIADDYDQEEEAARYEEFGGFSSEEEEDDLEDFDSFVGQGMSLQDFASESPKASKASKSKQGASSASEDDTRGTKRKRGDKGKRPKKHLEIEYDEGEREKQLN